MDCKGGHGLAYIVLGTMGKRTPGGKAQMISACKELQDEVISIDTTIHALEERMLKIIGMSKG